VTADSVVVSQVEVSVTHHHGMRFRTYHISKKLALRSPTYSRLALEPFTHIQNGIKKFHLVSSEV
jgi:hypothetical protein